tara:strand:+ start:553 stop:1266 length:714 start_codon:yes stop_codon:yes gene_type:complete
MKVTAEEIQRDWNKLIKIIETTFQGERKEKLLKMYKHFKDRLLLAPASGTDYYHNAFPGGYLKHILNVIQFSVKMFKLWKECGAYINYTKEEIIFASMHHDLGKLGDLENDHYVPNPSEWHRKNQGKIYAVNSDIQFMNTFDRTMMILAHFGISLSTNELLGIKLADGLYDEANVPYFKTYYHEKKLKSNLAYIIHQADEMTARIEYENWLHKDDDKKQQDKKKAEQLKGVFDGLFK